MLSDVQKGGGANAPTPFSVSSTGPDQEIDKRIIQYKDRKHFTPNIFVVKVTGAKWFETFSKVSVLFLRIINLICVKLTMRLKRHLNTYKWFQFFVCFSFFKPTLSLFENKKKMHKYKCSL